MTGAAGSVRLELSLEIALINPGKLNIPDLVDSPFVGMDLELRERFPELAIILVVRDVTNLDRVEALFVEHEFHQVFHLAAFKHVPMMELKAEQAERNNVFGTWNVAEAAGERGVEKFVLISTDKAVKAVKPVNVMGGN